MLSRSLCRLLVYFCCDICASCLQVIIVLSTIVVIRETSGCAQILAPKWVFKTCQRVKEATYVHVAPYGFADKAPLSGELPYPKCLEDCWWLWPSILKPKSWMCHSQIQTRHLWRWTFQTLILSTPVQLFCFLQIVGAKNCGPVLQHPQHFLNAVLPLMTQVVVHFTR